VKGIVFDLDGTLVRGPDALPGAVDAVAKLRAMGVSIAFCTQDSVNPPDHVATKLARLGFGAEPGDVFCAGWFAASHLARTYPCGRIYAICSPDLRRSFLEQGVELVSSADAATAQVVFVARDPKMTAEIFSAACTAIWAGATFYAFGHDRLLPSAGRNAPGAGAFVKAIEFATRQRARVLGKPSRPLARATLRRLGVRPEEAIVVGDSLDSDIRLGKGVGAGGVLVLTGGTTAEDAESATGPRKPDAVLASVAALPAWLSGA
jgi:4-nitrophenyl phosphatase